MTTPEPTNPAAAVEVRDRCPHCGDHQLVPRRQMAEHLARLHPEVPAVSGVQPDTRPVPCSLAVLHRPHGAHEWEPQPGMTPVNCPGAAPSARPVPDTERRDRWDTAWPDPFGTLTAERVDAVRAMKAKLRTIADGEQRDLRAYAADLEQKLIDMGGHLAANTHLRAENQHLRRAHKAAGKELAELCEELEVQVSGKRDWMEASEVRREQVVRLRAELEQARATTLTADERQFLTFALDQAADEMSLGEGFTDDDRAALAKLRGMAAAAPGGQAEDGASQK